MGDRHNILLPVETIARELDDRLFLAVHHAHPGNRIFVGKHWALMRVADRTYGGIYFGKPWVEPFNTADMATRDRLKARGYRCVHHDTEGAVYSGGEPQWRRILDSRLDPSRLAGDDYVATWGDFQRDYYRSGDPACKDNIRTVGGPGFDLYKRAYRSYYDADVAALHDRFGDFILVNSNFGLGNHQAGESFVFSSANGYDLGDADRRLFLVDGWANKAIVFARFVQLVHRLSIAFPQVQLVVRPHPSENRKRWREVTAGIANVHVLHEGPVAPWILASRVLVHDGCTTAIEAHLAGRGVVSYRAADDPTQEIYLPNVFGARCTSPEAVVEHVEAAFRGTLPPGEEVPDLARRLLANLEADAFERTRGLLREVEPDLPEPQECPLALLTAREGLHDTVEQAKHLVRPLSKRHRRVGPYARSKFPGLHPETIARKLARVQTILGREVRHRVLGRELLIIEAD